MIMPQAEASKFRSKQYLTDEQLEKGVNDRIKRSLDKMVSRVTFEVTIHGVTYKQWGNLKRKIKKAGYKVVFCGIDYTRETNWYVIEFLID